MQGDRQSHWENVYTSKNETEVSWFEQSPGPSLQIITELAPDVDLSVIDIGGGASRLVDALIEKGFRDLTVLDLSAAALDAAKARLGARAAEVHWLVADATSWTPPGTYDIWHDRAAFHFLTEERDRASYIERMKRALRTGGHAVMATFAPDGPERCSGLSIVRYDAESLGRTLGDGFELVGSRPHAHVTPWGSNQSFQFSVFRRDESIRHPTRQA